MVFRCAALCFSADHNCEQSIVLDEVSFLECSHRVMRLDVDGAGVDVEGGFFDGFA